MSKSRPKKATLEERSHNVKIQIAQKKLDYIRNKHNGDYYSARASMIAQQLNSQEVEEMIDGCIKTDDLMRSEYHLMKMQAINSYTNAQGAKNELMSAKTWKVTEEEIEVFEREYFDKPIVRKDYDEIFIRTKEAKFVK